MILEGKYEVDHNIYYEFDRKQRPIGEGGMGVVYKGVCVNRKTNAIRDVAIKEIHVEVDDPSFAYAIVERARREASIKFNNDNLIEMLGFVEVEDVKFNSRRTRYYVISEFLRGVTLQDTLQGKYHDYLGAPVDAARELYEMYRINREDTASKIIKSILYGVTALHDSGFIHRDIDPSNIMVTEDGKIKLIDFGIAKKSNTLTSKDDLKTRPGGMVGKIRYAAPELIKGDIESQCSATDIYSIGVLFYELLTGRAPFEGDDVNVINGHLRKKPNLGFIHNRKYRDIVAKAMAKKPNERYSSSSEMRVALDVVPPPFPVKTMIVSVVVLSIVLFSLLKFVILPRLTNDDVDIIHTDDVILISDEVIEDTLQVSNIIPVQPILNSSIDELWNIISEDSRHPIALYALSMYYENRKLDERAVKFWNNVLSKEGGEVERYIKRERGRSVVRFTFVTATRAYDNVENYEYDNESFVQNLKTRILALLQKYPDNFDYPKIED